MKVGERIKVLRRARALSQEALAERVGVSGRHIGHLESGAHQPSLPLLERLSDALGVPAGTLLADEMDDNERSAARREAQLLLDGLDAGQLRLAVRLLSALRGPEAD